MSCLRRDCGKLDFELYYSYISQTRFFNTFTFFQTLSVEFAHVDSGKGALKDFMESKGYTAVAEVTDPNWLANDFIFAKKHN